MVSTDEKKKSRKTLEIDLSKLPLKEATILLSALMDFSLDPSMSSATKVLRAFYRVTRKLGLVPLYPVSRVMARKRPPDEPTRRRR